MVYISELLTFYVFRLTHKAKEKAGAPKHSYCDCLSSNSEIFLDETILCGCNEINYWLGLKHDQWL